MSRAARRSPRLAFAIAGALALAVPHAPARAHGQKPHQGRGHIEPVLDALPDALASLRVQLHESLAPQLVVENPGDAPLEILDELGAPLLRIGPGGVEANLASPSWYRTASPSDAVPVPQAVLEAGAAGRTLPPRWRRVAREPAWGWFDRRIEIDELEAPAAVVAAARSAEVGRWEIPVRLGEASASLRGRFVYRPAETGRLRLRLDSAPEIVPGVRLSVLPGRIGSFFLRSDAATVTFVLGREGEPFLRFSPEGVAANRRSPTFAEVARLRGGRGLVRDVDAAAAPEWQTLSSSPRYGWVDPRTLAEASEAVAGAGAAVELVRWVLPVRVGEGEDAATVRIEGATLWEPFARGAASERPKP